MSIVQGRPTLFHQGNCELGEGPYVCRYTHRLLWVDIVGQRVQSISLDGEDYQSQSLAGVPGAVVPCRKGGLLVAMQSGIYRVDDMGDYHLLCHPEADRPQNRYNDGKCDTQGRFWVGSLSTTGVSKAGRLWKVTADGSAIAMEVDLGIANGMGWSPDDKYFYLTDSEHRCIYRYEFDVLTGALCNREILMVFDESEGVPDGLCVDDQGCLWSAMWDGSQVLCLSPDGVIMHRVGMPVPRPTSCAFGPQPAVKSGDSFPPGSSESGAGDALYVTSARVGLSDAVLQSAPLSGSVFTIPVDCRGLPANRFG